MSVGKKFQQAAGQAATETSEDATSNGDVTPRGDVTLRYRNRSVTVIVGHMFLGETPEQFLLYLFYLQTLQPDQRIPVVHDQSVEHVRIGDLAIKVPKGVCYCHPGRRAVTQFLDP